MACLYKENLIDIIGNSYIENFISQSSDDEIFELYENLMKDSSRKNVQFLYGFENYLIKSYDTVKDKNIKNKLEQLITRFYDYISLDHIKDLQTLITRSNLFKSTLAREDIINKFASSKQKEEIRKTKNTICSYSKKIAEKYQRYFDRKITYLRSGNSYANDQELKRYELSFYEKKLMLNFMQMIKIKDSKPEEWAWAKDTQKKYFVELVADNRSRPNIYEQEFVVHYAITNFFPLENLEKVELGIMDNLANNADGETRGRNFINIKYRSSSYGTNFSLVQIACHEAEHIYQSTRINRDGEYSDVGYYYMLFELTTSYPQKGNDGTKEYLDDYEYAELEIDAEYKSAEKMQINLPRLFKEFGLDTKKLEENIKETKDHIEDRRPYFISRKTLNDYSVPSFLYNITRLSEIAKDHPEVVKRYPMLNKLFDENGNIKEKDDIIIKQDCTGNELLKDFIISKIYLDEIEELDITQYSNEDKKRFIENIDKCFEREMRKIISFLNHPGKIMKENGLNSLVDNISIMCKFAKIYCDNFDIIEENKIGLSSFHSLEILLRKFNEENKVLNNIMQHKKYSPYIPTISLLKQVLTDLYFKYQKYRYDDWCESRREHIISNNLVEENKKAIKSIFKEGNYESEFLNMKIKDNLGDVITVREYIENFAVYNLSNGTVYDFYRNSIPLKNVLDNFYKTYLSNKVSQGINPNGIGKRQ